MAASDMELRPVDFMTVGTVGPRGQRVFYIQGAQGDSLVTLVIEKFQAKALSEAIGELLKELDERHPREGATDEVNLRDWELDLREPIDPEFRVSQIGLGFDEASDLVVLVAQELSAQDQEETDELSRTVRFWAGRDLMRVLGIRADRVVDQGRPDPRQNGRIHYYWT